jgi:hypothetical protein
MSICGGKQRVHALADLERVVGEEHLDGTVRTHEVNYRAGGLGQHRRGLNCRLGESESDRAGAEAA